MTRDAGTTGDAASAPSIYDAPRTEDPWFVPPPVPPVWEPGRPVGADTLMRPDDWIAAERRLGRELARATAAAARLDERVRQAGPGALRRLAMTEAAALSWHAGGRVAVERLALHDLDRADMVRDDAGALGAAHWAFRRLSGGPGPGDSLGDFLGRADVADLPAAIRWAEDLAGLSEALPVVRAAWSHFCFRAAGLAADALEPAVIAGRVGGTGARALPFLALAYPAAPFFAGGDAADRLRAWARGAEGAAMRSLMTLDALDAWEVRARQATARLSGRTPALLVEALQATPALSAGMAARATGASVPGARRNLRWFERAGLVREITGQGRFRFWQAAL